jgi:peptidoglycan-associated lipoprotein
MKRFTNLVIIALLLTVAVVGCRKKPGYLTPLPGKNATAIQDPGTAGRLGSGTEGVNPAETSGIPLGDPSKHDNWTANAEIFKDRTVYFAFDSSAVQAGEKSKIAAVADYLKANNAPRTAVRVEGHCDERGTEEYNRALGERRALAVREELISLGIDPTRVDTVSFGEDRPAAPGHDEAAWRKNRRGEFILLTEP